MPLPLPLPPLSPFSFLQSPLLFVVLEPLLIVLLHTAGITGTTQHYTTLDYTTPCQTIPHHTTPYLTTLHHTTLSHTTLHYTTLHYTTLHYTTLHYTTLHYTTLHYTTLHYTFQTLLVPLGGGAPRTCLQDLCPVPAPPDSLFRLVTVK